MTDQQIEVGLARSIFGPHTGWKTVTARNVLNRKREQDAERRRAERDSRRERGEVARDKHATLFWAGVTAIGMIAGLVLTHLPRWRDEIGGVLKLVLYPFKAH